MTQNEMELISIIREADEPTKVAEVFVDILQRCVAGEGMESIAVSYSLAKDTASVITA